MKNHEYLIVNSNEVTLVKRIGSNVIYCFKNKYYVGIQTIFENDTEIEDCIEFTTLEDAETFAYEINSIEKTE